MMDPILTARTRDESRAFNEAIELAAKIAGPQYHKAKPGLWSREKQRLADAINACKLEIGGA